MASTITLQTVVNFAATHAELLPLSGVGGFTNEPALSICNDALSEIINADHDWKWNKVELLSNVQPLVTMQNIQDYYFAGASAFCPATSVGNTSFASSGVGIGLSSANAITVTAGVVTVNTLQPHQFVVGATVYLTGIVMSAGTASKYLATYTDTGTMVTWGNGFVITAIGTTSFTFAAVAGQNNGDAGGAAGITNWGWGTAATMQELNNNSSPPNHRQMKVRRDLDKWNKCSDPDRVAMISDPGTGILTFRFQYVPGSTIWLVNLVYQQASPILTALTSTWAPIPDMYGSLIRQAVLYRMYRYLNSPRADTEYKKLQYEIARVQGRDNSEESQVYLEPEDSIVDYGPYWVGY